MTYCVFFESFNAVLSTIIEISINYFNEHTCTTFTKVKTVNKIVGHQ